MRVRISLSHFSCFFCDGDSHGRTPADTDREAPLPHAMASELSAYEKERLETIKKNHEKLVALGLESAANEVREAAAAKRSQDTAEKKERQARFPNLKVATEATRVSKRLREVFRIGDRSQHTLPCPAQPNVLCATATVNAFFIRPQVKPQYTGEKIDRFGEVLDEQIEKRTRMGSSAEEKAAARAEMMENARKLLEAAREKLRSERSAKRVSAGSDPSGWRAEAIRRWGKRAGDCNTDDWEGYVASREATPAPTSPEPLLQEHFADSPWKLLVACALMSRVSSHETKTRCIEGFFQLCPTPTALLDTDPHDVEQIILPLGLFDNRWRCATHSAPQGQLHACEAALHACGAALHARGSAACQCGSVARTW